MSLRGLRSTLEIYLDDCHTIHHPTISLSATLPNNCRHLPTLYERTEGWAAGMYLIMLLDPHHEPQPRMHALLNPQRAIRDYLYEKVLTQ